MEWTPRPTPCPSSPLLWDWDATAGEESGAKRGKQHQGGGAAGAGAEAGRVCEAHSKCPRVVVAGQERHFCQQCSRFHAPSEFDQNKRSCRRRLSDHNARRRKPQPDVFSFGSAVLPSSLFGASGAASKLDGAPDVRRALSLSLLSASSWGSTDPVQKTSSFIQLTDANTESLAKSLAFHHDHQTPQRNMPNLLRFGFELLTVDMDNNGSRTNNRSRIIWIGFGGARNGNIVASNQQSPGDNDHKLFDASDKGHTSTRQLGGKLEYAAVINRRYLFVF